MKESGHFTIPESILRQVNECSGGGYVLFAIDDHGVPAVYCKFDNPIAEMARISYATKWGSAMEDLLQEIALRSILGRGDGDEDQNAPK